MKQTQGYDYDLAVIGAGPGGYVAAAKAGEAGMKTLLVEQEHLGGVCLNCGCIPTKTLLYSAKGYFQAVSQNTPGVMTKDTEFSMEEAQQWKDQVVSTYRNAVAAMMKSAKVEVMTGFASFRDRSTLAVGEKTVTAGNIIIASGSRPAIPPIEGADLPHVLTSTGLLEQKTLPSSLAVIGGGVIGLEFACLYAQLGVEVYVIEMLSHAASVLDGDIRKALLRSLKSLKNLHIYTDAQVTKITGTQVHFTMKGKQQAVDADTVLLAVGRTANTEALNLTGAGVKTSKGYVLVNDQLQTSAPRVYAIGDVIGKSLYAHAASRMGEVAVEVILGNRNTVMHYHAVPWAVYTSPEAAGCGMSEEDAAGAGINFLAVTIPMRYSARYYAEHKNQPGIVKLLADRDSREIIGVHAAGAQCSEMIWGAALAVQNRLTVDQLGTTIFPHPSVSEVIREAALLAVGRLKEKGE